MKNALILFSHGSVLCGAGENLKALAARMRQPQRAEQMCETQSDATPIIEVGYLNYSEPSFASAFARCVEQGATSITVMPYFLIAGKFVQVDLPRAIAEQQALFPHIRVLVADAMRAHPLLADALLSCAGRAAPPDEWRNIWNTASQFCRADAQCPLFGTAKCPATSNVENVNADKSNAENA